MSEPRKIRIDNCLQCPNILDVVPANVAQYYCTEYQKAIPLILKDTNVKEDKITFSISIPVFCKLEEYYDDDEEIY